jgi:hypothetical protein
MVISWKKRDGSKDQYLATGDHLMTGDDRIQVETERMGSTLVITLAKTSDVGEYICEVSSNPPAVLRQKVSIIGEECEFAFRVATN